MNERRKYFDRGYDRGPVLVDEGLERHFGIDGDHRPGDHPLAGAFREEEVELGVGGRRQGVELATSETFDLVLTDLGMPDMSGWEVAKQIRAARPQVPIIFVTGWGTSLSREEVESSGVAAVIHKPFEIRELLQTTGEVLRAEPVAADEMPRPL